MKQLSKHMFIISFILIASMAVLHAQSTTVENIRNYPRNYSGNNVTVKGLVTQYTRGDGSTSYYLLKGDFGSIIRVNTAEAAPETNAKYEVEGIVYIDEPTGTPFISEKKKTAISGTAEPQSNTSTASSESTSNNLMIYILIGAVIFLTALYFIIKSMQGKKEPKPYQQPDYTPTAPYMASDIKLDTNDMVSQSNDDFKTIRISNASPKTLKFIPGKLTIISGEDAGKSFKIAGYPTTEGSIVSIGRDEVKGDRSYSHIQLMQKTISRKQAEIIQKDGKVYVKNLSETNYSQVDGIELQPNAKEELKPGSSIRLGELELKYEL